MGEQPVASHRVAHLRREQGQHPVVVHSEHHRIDQVRAGVGLVLEVGAVELLQAHTEAPWRLAADPRKDLGIERLDVVLLPDVHEGSPGNDRRRLLVLLGVLGDDLLLLDHEEHGQVGRRVDGEQVRLPRPRLAEVLHELWGDLGPSHSVEVRQPEHGELVAVHEDPVGLALAAHATGSRELLLDDGGQGAEVVGEVLRAQAPERGAALEGERPRLEVPPVPVEHLVQAHHHQQVPAVHDVLADDRVDPAVHEDLEVGIHDLAAPTCQLPIAPHVVTEHLANEVRKGLAEQLAV